MCGVHYTALVSFFFTIKRQNLPLAKTWKPSEQWELLPVNTKQKLTVTNRRKQYGLNDNVSLAQGVHVTHFYKAIKAYRRQEVFTRSARRLAF